MQVRVTDKQVAKEIKSIANSIGSSVSHSTIATLAIRFGLPKLHSWAKEIKNINSPGRVPDKLEVTIP